MLLAEDSVYILAPENIRRVAGSILSAVWYLCTTFLVLSFLALLRAALIKEDLPGILKDNFDVIKSKRDLILLIFNRDLYDSMEFSESEVDQYIFKKAKKVITFGE